MPAPVWENKENKTGDKLMKQMENLLKLPKTDETSTLYDIEKAQVWETGILKSKEGLNLDFER